MADFNSVYTLVKKQDEKIDGLLKTSKSNQELLMGIETRLTATPADTAAPTATTPEEIHVVLPENIATNESVRQLVDAALKQQKIDALKSLDLSQLPKELAEAFAKFFKDGLDDSVKKTLLEGISDAFNSQTREFREAGKQLNNRMYSVINGAVWAAIPKWAYAVVGVVFLAAIGFGYGFFTQLSENSKLRDIEWLYRRERAVYSTDESRQSLINRERDFITGTPHEQDSIKDIVHYWEHKNGLDKTFLYFNPSEE